MSADCIFCKIVNDSIPSKKIYEDEDVIAFNDINPSAKVHFLIVPKVHIDSLATQGITFVFFSSRYLDVSVP